MSAVVSQAEKAVQFQALHRRPGAFVIPNPWDAGSARILASLGFEALATSSGAVAGTLRLSAETGPVGGSIEDAAGDGARQIYDLSHAIERVQAAVAAARALP